MKKTIILSMAMSILTIGAAQAATTSTPVSEMIQTKASAINKIENDVAQNAEARKQAANAKQAEIQKQKAQKAKELKAKQAEAQKRQDERNRKIETKKQQIKDVFTK